MEFKEILTAFLGKGLQIPTTEIDSLLDESKSPAEVEAAILSTHAKHIEKVTAPFTAKNEEQKKYGIRVGSEAYEKPLKQKFGLPAELQGEELINALAEKMSSANAIDEDKVKLSKPYRDLQDKFDTAKTEHTNALTTLQTEFQEKQEFAAVKDSVVWPALTKAGYVMPQNQNQANILRNQYESELSKVKPEKQTDGKVLAKENGEYKKDAHGNFISYEAYATSLAGNYFDVANNNGGASPKNAGAGNNGGAGAKKFSNYEDLQKYVRDPAIPSTERRAAMEQWKADNPDSK